MADAMPPQLRGPRDKWHRAALCLGLGLAACAPDDSEVRFEVDSAGLRLGGTAPRNQPPTGPRYGVIAAPAPAAAASGHALWRRQAIDLCHRLPTAGEVDCITANGGDADFPACGRTTSTADSILAACVQSESFAEDIAGWINDFALPHRYLHSGNHALHVQSSIIWNQAYLNIAGVSSTIRYWHARIRPNHSAWRDCLEAQHTPQSPLVLTNQAQLGQYLEKAYNPYFYNGQGSDQGFYTDAQGVYVWVCKQGSPAYDGQPNDYDSTVATPAEFLAYNSEWRAGSDTDNCEWPYTQDHTFSLTNNSVHTCTISGNETSAGALRAQRCGNGIRNFPCGCGDNLRWCLPLSTLDGPPGNWNAFFDMVQEEKNEAFRLVKNIVLAENGLVASEQPTFMHIFTAGYSVMTSRLLRANEAFQSNWDTSTGYGHTNGDAYRTDECYSQITGVSKTNPDMPRDEVVTLQTGCVNNVCSPNPPSAIAMSRQTVCPDGILPATINYDQGGGDWQKVRYDQASQFAKVPLAYKMGGILTMTQQMRRQPTETNLASHIYQFFTCSEVSYRGLYGGWWATPYRDGWTINTPSSGGAVPFSALVRTNAAMEPLRDVDLKPTCMGCHLTVTPMAAFRNRWDAWGLYGFSEPVGYQFNDADGVFLGQGASDMRGLATLLADSQVVHTCIVNRSVERLTGHRLSSASPTLHQLTADFRNGFDIRALYRAIAETDEYKRAN